MTTSNEIIQFLRQHKNILKEKYFCTEIGLFGSFARNEQTDKSDIDIIVEFDTNAPDLYTIENELKEYLKKNLKREIDICSKKWIKPIFKPLVLKDAIYA
ncbi:nucleotidyltransferase family protein [Roseimarinus sediminis]|uniref:nucleotidyltransferase family protein n=1 Tax=Roseimarinus sediminis TaxID=1610899 RepID=UPI003D21379F